MKNDFYVLTEKEVKKYKRYKDWINKLVHTDDLHKIKNIVRKIKLKEKD